MDKEDAHRLIESNEEMVYRILSHLEHSTSMDGFIYADPEQDLYFTIFFALGDIKYIKFVIPQHGVHPNYEKRITPDGKDYLRYLKKKFDRG